MYRLRTPNDVINDQKFNVIVLIVVLITILILAFNPQTVQAQATLTPTPEVYYQYVDIDGRTLQIAPVVSLGDIGLSIIGLAILSTLFIYVAYRIVVDKLG